MPDHFLLIRDGCTMLDAVIDLSHWQASVDFARLKAAGIEAVILKASQGSTWVDPKFVLRCSQAATAGLLVGAYHFCDATSALAQVDHFLTLAQHLPVLAIDVEANALAGETVSVELAAEIAARLQARHGRHPLVYVGRYGPDAKGTGFPNSVLMNCPLWLPAYSEHSPVCPLAWPSWTLWQYTATGPVDGISDGFGNPVACDRNRFNGTLDALKTWWGK
jgi:lysozyme